MAEIVVFAGPTVPTSVVRGRLAGRDVQVAPPATQGDVARVVEMADPPRVVALIDGSYERVPAVWHKELLYALELGVATARSARPCARPVAAVEPAVLADLLDGLWLDGVYLDLARAATLRLITADTAARAGTRPRGAALAGWVAQVAERVPAADLADLDDAGLRALAADQAALVQACAEVEDRLPAGIIDTLRVRGEYAERLVRARAVTAGCDAFGAVSDPAILGCSEADLWAWCAARAGLPPGTPPDVITDLVGAPDRHRLRRAALRHLTLELKGH